MQTITEPRDDTPVTIKVWADGVNIEEQAMQQAKNVAKMPFIFKHVALMPDAHFGIGATVGSVIPTKKAIIPAAVGVDIGCGMAAVQLDLKAEDLPDSLKELRSNIEAVVPVGSGRKGSFENPPDDSLDAWADLADGLDDIFSKHPKLKGPHGPDHQVGTLGGGNHFIELCLDEDKNVWVMLHSGSRGIGNQIGRYFISRAKEDMLKLGVSLPDDDLAYVAEGTDNFDDYWAAVKWSQEYAFQNREVMMARVLRVVSETLNRLIVAKNKVINCHHNYVSLENHFGENVYVTRKGAIRAREGEMGIIPGSMGTQSYIVRGKGNPESFHSCSHGAGRSMSRGEAKRRFTLDDHIKATEGVECRKDEKVIDETPMAYKDIDKVMAAQVDLIEPVVQLKQVLCVKG